MGNKTQKKILVSTIACVFIFSVFVLPLSLGETYPLLNPLVITFGQDDLISDTAKTLASNIEEAVVIPISNLLELQLVERKAAREVFYVGHGSEEGIHMGSQIVEWSCIDEILDRSASPLHYLATCESSNVDTEKPVFTFEGPVDADLAASAILAHYYWIRGEYDTYVAFLATMYTQILTKMADPSKLRYLGTAWYRGIKWDKLDTPVLYEHPNRPYYGISSYYTSKNIQGSNSLATHLSVDLINAWWWTGLFTGCAAVIAGGIAVILAAIPEPVISKLAAAIVGLIAIIINIAMLLVRAFIDIYVRDEWGGCGWSFNKDMAWVSTGGNSGYLFIHNKMGKWMWVYGIQYFDVFGNPGVPLTYPEYYGYQCIGHVPL